MRKPPITKLPTKTATMAGYQPRTTLCIFCEAKLYRTASAGATVSSVPRPIRQQRRQVVTSSSSQFQGQQRQQQRQQHSGPSASSSAPTPPPTAAGPTPANSQAQADAVRKALSALNAKSWREKELWKPQEKADKTPEKGRVGFGYGGADATRRSSNNDAAGGTSSLASKTPTVFELGSFLDGLGQKKSRVGDGSIARARQRQQQQQLQPQERTVRRAPPPIQSEPEPEPESRPLRPPVKAPYDSQLVGGWQHLHRSSEQQPTQTQPHTQPLQQRRSSEQTDAQEKSSWDLLKESQGISKPEPQKRLQRDQLMGARGASQTGSQKMSQWDLLKKSQSVSEHVSKQKKQENRHVESAKYADYLRESQQREEQTRNGRYVGLSNKSARRCFHCNEEGHNQANCPVRLASNMLRGRRTDAAGMTRPRDVVTGFNDENSVSIPMRSTEMDRVSDDSEFSRGGHRRSRQRKSLLSDRFDLEYQPDDKQVAAAEEKKRKKEEKRREREAKKKEVVAGPTPIFLPDFISVSNLATALKIPVEAFIEKMEDLGFESVTNDHILNAENAGLIAMEYGFEPAAEGNKKAEDDDLRAQPWPEDKSSLPLRPPVVTIMGHVDHGKTTILDYLRKTSVAASEHGGITQHIGAFSVPIASGKTITFLDTPGHAAFLSMRERGANVTDIIVLVVAADDGVKPQTVEAIKHAKAAQVPIIVAINKIDKDEAAPDRVKSELARNEIDIEDYGGETQTALISGKTGTGIDQLEEAIITLSEILDHRAPPDGPVEGWVLEASTNKAGRAATLLVRRGTLRQGDVIVAGTSWARVRLLRNEAGVNIDEAGPGMPVEVQGWRGQPIAGDEVLQAPSEQRATTAIRTREGEESRQRLAEDTQAINQSRRLDQEQRERDEAAAAEELAVKAAEAQKFGRTLHWRTLKWRSLTKLSTEFSTVEESSGTRYLNLVIKADVSGSGEAVVNAVSGLGNNEVQPRILRTSVGSISESDIDLASAASGHILSFNVPVEPKIAQEAEARKVNILEHKIIYRLADDVKNRLSELLPPAVEQRMTGEAEVLQLFGIDVKKRKDKLMIAGCKIRNGVVAKGSKARVLRDRKVVHEGMYTFRMSLSSLLRIPIERSL